MVFGDNVRARWAARALPRTPTTKKRERQEEKDKRRDHSHTHPSHRHSTTHRVDSAHHAPHALLPNTNHRRHSTMTQPCHKHTTLNQQCCDSKHKKRGRGTGQYERGVGQCKVPAQSEHGEQHTPTTPRHSTGPPRKRKGDTTRRRGTPTPQPPFTHHATHHPRWPHPPPT